MSSTSSGFDRLLTPRHGLGVCCRCLNLTSDDGALCRACRAGENHLAGVLPISYSVGGEWLHHMIASYKRDADPSVDDAVAMLTAICEGFIPAHEECLAATAGVAGFDLVTTVPSSDARRDERHPLRRIVGARVAATRDRHERLLARSDRASVPRVHDPRRYLPMRRLHGEAVLLIDDMWTSGASAQSAAAALHDAGAGAVAAIVIARHLNRGWRQNDLRLRRLAADGFDLGRCAMCAELPGKLAAGPPPPSGASGGLTATGDKVAANGSIISSR